MLDEEEEDDIEEDEDLDSSEDDVDMSSEGGSGFEIEEELVKNDDQVFSSEGNADFYDRHDFDLDSSDQGDFYEIEWDLDFKTQ